MRFTLRTYTLPVGRLRYVTFTRCCGATFGNYLTGLPRTDSPRLYVCYRFVYWLLDVPFGCRLPLFAPLYALLLPPRPVPALVVAVALRLLGCSVGCYGRTRLCDFVVPGCYVYGVTTLVVPVAVPGLRSTLRFVVIYGTHERFPRSLTLWTVTLRCYCWLLLVVQILRWWNGRWTFPAHTVETLAAVPVYGRVDALPHRLLATFPLIVRCPSHSPSC